MEKQYIAMGQVRNDQGNGEIMENTFDRKQYFVMDKGPPTKHLRRLGVRALHPTTSPRDIGLPVGKLGITEGL